MSSEIEFPAYEPQWAFGRDSLTFRAIVDDSKRVVCVLPEPTSKTSPDASSSKCQTIRGDQASFLRDLLQLPAVEYPRIRLKPGRNIGFVNFLAPTLALDTPFAASKN
jgi:hypothetical protein